MTDPRSLTVSLYLKKGGNGRQSFPIGFLTFSGEGNHVMNVRKGYGWVGMCGVSENLRYSYLNVACDLDSLRYQNLRSRA